MVKIGIHVSKKSEVLKTPIRKTMLDAIQGDISLNINAIQIFNSGPRNSRMNKMDYLAIADFCKNKNINLYVHSNYISVGIFNLNKENCDTPKMKTAIKNITEQMSASDKLNSKGFVIHISKKSPNEIIETLKILYPYIKKFKTPMLLEQPAKKSDKDLTYETPEKINNLTQLIKKNIPKLNWGWCLDTVHLWSSGININNYDIVEKYFNDLKYPEYIKLFHLNGGSKNIFNTGKDLHIIPFSNKDDIFTNQTKKSSINIIINFAKKNNVDLIMEIKRGTTNDSIYAIEFLNSFN